MSEQLTSLNKAIKKKFSSKKLIFGRGLEAAKIVFVSEMPGPDEHKEQKPIAGQHEKTLNRLLKTAGIDKRRVYMTNVIKYSPDINKAFTFKEIKASLPFLKEELKTIQPDIVVTLGNIALNGIGMRQPLDNVHGKVFNLGSFELFPTFHPKDSGDPDVKMYIESDFMKLREILKAKKNPPKEEDDF